MAKKPNQKPQEEFQYWWGRPRPVNIADPAEFEGLDLPDYRIRCADCAMLRDIAGLYGLRDNGRCTASPTTYHPIPEQRRNCPFNSYIPRVGIADDGATGEQR